MALQTRREILETARALFAERGYAATSVTDIAEQAGVAVQTIYARLGSKHGIVVALLDLIDEEAGVAEAAAEVATAATPEQALRSEIRLREHFRSDAATSSAPCSPPPRSSPSFNEPLARASAATAKARASRSHG